LAEFHVQQDTVSQTGRQTQSVSPGRFSFVCFAWRVVSFFR
jgi:hypothetical protein